MLRRRGLQRTAGRRRPPVADCPPGDVILGALPVPGDGVVGNAVKFHRIVIRRDQLEGIGHVGQFTVAADADVRRGQLAVDGDKPPVKAPLLQKGRGKYREKLLLIVFQGGVLPLQDLVEEGGASVRLPAYLGLVGVIPAVLVHDREGIPEQRLGCLVRPGVDVVLLGSQKDLRAVHLLPRRGGLGCRRGGRLRGGSCLHRPGRGFRLRHRCGGRIGRGGRLPAGQPDSHGTARQQSRRQQSSPKGIHSFHENSSQRSEYGLSRIPGAQRGGVRPGRAFLLPCILSGKCVRTVSGLFLSAGTSAPGAP